MSPALSLADVPKPVSIHFTPCEERNATAVHEAGHAVMTICLGGEINHEGVEIDERQYCGSKWHFSAGAPCFATHKESTYCLHAHAGWQAENLWHGYGYIHQRDRLSLAIESVLVTGDVDRAEDHSAAVIAILNRTPDATEHQIKYRWTRYANQCRAILTRPRVWKAVDAIAVALLARGKLAQRDIEDLFTGSTAFLRMEYRAFEAGRSIPPLA